MVPLALDPPGGEKSPNYNTILLGPNLSFLVPPLPSTVPSIPPFRAPPETRHSERSRKLAGSTNHQPPRKTCYSPRFSRRGSSTPKPGVVPPGPETPRKPDPDGQLRYAGQEAEG